MKHILCLLFFLSLTTVDLVAATHNIKEYGAIGDGKHIDSPAINAAIEAAAQNGGGTVYIPTGK